MGLGQTIIMEQAATNAWEMINECMNFGAERWMRKAKACIKRCNEFLQTLNIDTDDASIQNRIDEIIALHIIEKKLPAKSLEFYRMNAARKRLIQSGILQKKSRGGWKINKKLDPRK